MRAETSRRTLMANQFTSDIREAMTMPTSQPVSVMSGCRAADCAVDSAGHGLNLAQRRAAAASRRKWRDAIVLDTSTDGWITLGLVHDDSTVRVWSHVDENSTPPAIGEPVSVHTVFNVLSRGRDWRSVLVA